MRLDEMLFPLGEPFLYFPGMVTRFNISVSAAVLAGYLAWKTLPDEQDGWRSVNMREVQTGTGLTVKEQATARKQLVEAGLIEEFYARLEHKIKIRFLPVSGNGHLPKEQMAIIPNSKWTNGTESEREDTPIVPKGDNENEDVQTSPLTSLSNTENSPTPRTLRSPSQTWTPSAFQLRLGRFFRRKPTTPWSQEELKAFRKISEPDEEDMARLESYYLYNWPSSADYRRRDLKTLLNNFASELDRARGWKEPNCL